MTKKVIKTIELLPEILRTNKNSKFLSSTLDQLIQPPQLERIDGYVGSKLTATFDPTVDRYISEAMPLRDHYQLDPALVVYDAAGNINSVTGVDDLINEISTKGGINSNIDRLFRSDVYSYDPHIDWDKLVNYQEYFWLSTGPDSIGVSGTTATPLDINALIVGQTHYTTLDGIVLSNGMLINFEKNVSPLSFQNNAYFVEGVGTAIVLVDYKSLATVQEYASIYNENFDAASFDQYPFDNFKTLPIVPEYVTINRASKDLNPWSRYNRWVHRDVISTSALANNKIESFSNGIRATRPIIEFAANLQLYNYGTVGIKPVDFIDHSIFNAFGQVNGQDGYYIDGVQLEHGNRIIFNADQDSSVCGQIYQVNFNIVPNKISLVLVTDDTLTPMISVVVDSGLQYTGTSWWYDGATWQFAQQHSKLNQAPLFDLFDSDGYSFSDKNVNLSNFSGNQLFGYAIGTGALDTVLGFPLKFKNSTGVGSYLFSNYFMTESFSLTSSEGAVIEIPTNSAFCKFNESTGDRYATVWSSVASVQIPILQFQTIETATTAIELTAIDHPETATLRLEVYVNNVKLLNTIDFAIFTTANAVTIRFAKQLDINSTVLFKIFTNRAPNSSGRYEAALGLTNNPLNGPIESFTLTELSDHLHSITDNIPKFRGKFLGSNNIRDLPNAGTYGRRLISNANPISFAQLFIGKKEHNVVDAIGIVCDQYNQFKMAFLNATAAVVDQTNPVAAVDTILSTINQNKNTDSAYFLSDMVAYGTDKQSTSWTISNTNNTVYPLAVTFDPTTLSLRSVLVYCNNQQLLLDKDYSFDHIDGTVILSCQLSVGDTITVNDYFDTSGSFVPSTPSKLGLYPKYQPGIVIDDTYNRSDSSTSPVALIQCHDGSTMLAYNDFRDDIILEFEYRVYNNIKSTYRSSLLDFNSVMPGAFRNTAYSPAEINSIMCSDFLKWAGAYSVDYSTNTTLDDSNSFSWNYQQGFNSSVGRNVSGTWRAVYDYFYDTDHPHTAPWKMLGFSKIPTWWESTYGFAPYTSKNITMWSALAQGKIADGPRAGIDPTYARPGLLSMLPVDSKGHLIPASALIANTSVVSRRQNWKFGDQSPAETAWRRSSYWPYAVQRLMALTVPATYASLMYDPVHLNKNIAGQWTYAANNAFLNPKTVMIPGNSTLTSGYSVMVVDAGHQRSTKYIQELSQDLTNLNFNLFYKVGGFVSKDKLQVVIDAYDPTSVSAGAILPPEDYSLILNTSNPIVSVGISGIIVQKVNDKFVVKGYDRFTPYFNTFTPLRNSTTPSETIGGVSEQYVTWVSSLDVGSSAASTGKFYQAGQIVRYSGSYYRVSISHQSSTTFNADYFQLLAGLPMTGGTSVQLATRFDSAVVQVPYGAAFSTVQEVYDVILGYGAWLSAQGFIFSYLNTEINEVINWNFTAREFIYWSTQNWANNSVITLSPFADQIQFSMPTAVVGNIFDSYYEYNLLQANGTPFPKTSLSVQRADGVCTIDTLNSSDGIYFAIIRAVQKEHAMVFKNTTIFNDTIYDIQTGYRQLRVLLSGFRTANWTGDYFSPGFVYDAASTVSWQQYADYQYSQVVTYNGSYYAANYNVIGTQSFDFTKWTLLRDKPVSGLLPNFDYKINQFEDFYSLDIDNFDSAQQKMAQHLIGYSPRVYLDNIFSSPVAQYKFYQGFIKEKGTKNAISKLSKASMQNLQGQLEFTEEWAFRCGAYGSYSTYQELEVPLVEGTFVENPQIIQFVDAVTNSNSLIYSSATASAVITPDNYNPTDTFVLADADTEFKLATAGYVRLDDVSATAYDQNSLLSIANNRDINEGDVIWVGFKPDGDWDVLSYTILPVSIQDVFVSVVAYELTFTTNLFHGVVAGDVISVSQFNSQVNGIYTVTSVPELNQFTVASTLTSLATPFTSNTGLLFAFISSRYPSFDQIPQDQQLLKMPINTKLWIDNKNGKWAVYEKTKNYTKTPTYGKVTQQLGKTISKTVGKNNGLVVISDSTANKYERVDVYRKINNVLQSQFNYSLNDAFVYSTSTNLTEFGYSIVHDDINFNNTSYGLIFVGAPAASNISGSTSNGLRVAAGYANNFETTSTRIQEGLVKISSINPDILSDKTELVLLSPAPAPYQRFGSSIYVEQSTGPKLMLVGAPGTQTSNTGHVYAYNINAVDRVVLSYAAELFANTTGISSSVSTVGNRWGHCISGSHALGLVAISAPGYQQNTGFVQIFRGLSHVQTIRSPFGIDAHFGQSVVMSTNGMQLFISAPAALNTNQAYGVVRSYLWNVISLQFDFVADLTNPANGPGMQFGMDLALNNSASMLTVSALGTNRTIVNTFDMYAVQSASGKYINDMSRERTAQRTSFDASTTTFHEIKEFSGIVYVYDQLFSRYVLAETLESSISDTNTNFGQCVVIDSTDSVYVGAPALAVNGPLSAVYEFDKIDSSRTSWSLVREQQPLVSTDVIRRVALIDSESETVLNYLDIIDPLKGKIAGLADQELKYKIAFDPAIYSIGVSSTIIDQTANWLDDHVGELWWDLSTVKYVWYEQGDVSYKKNNWGKLFPGATIDVYEWVGSEYRPSEWSMLADTADGLANNISGQPKFIDNSVVSVKQIYNSITNSFSNYYYFWVQSKTTVPLAPNRRISSFQVAELISNPTAYGVIYAAIIATDAISIANAGALLINSSVHLNIAFDTIDSNVPKHTEWELLKEGSATSMPNPLIEKKMIDSLLGHDSLGSPVPAVTLSNRTRYGIGIRPQQTLFKNRFNALRNLIEFANSVLAANMITGNYNFDRLQSQELVSDQPRNSYDQAVDEFSNLSAIDTRQFMLAKLSCTVKDGKIQSVVINSPGRGYLYAPAVTVTDQLNTGAQISTTIDKDGSVISATIVNSGNRFASSPVLIVRPFTVIVLADSTSLNKWAKYEHVSEKRTWIKTHTQQFNTNLYWSYIDWSHAAFNQFRDYTRTVADMYELTLMPALSAGQYVKVNNGGDSRYIILEKTQADTIGTFDADYNILYSQHGTIQIADSIWNLADGITGFDQNNSWDQTQYAQTVDIELRQILSALKSDIFIGQLAVNWNLFFFKAVKYALSEQQSLDWAFKTSFINVVNRAGNLEQRPVYKLQNSEFYEEYLKEVKPYHTGIRSFVTAYDVDEPVNTALTEIVNCKIDIKFDRTSVVSQVGNTAVTDEFICNGNANTFELSWSASYAPVNVTLNDSIVLKSDYIIENYSKTYNGYAKKFSRIVFNTYVPTNSQLLKVQYVKNIQLLDATDRILSVDRSNELSTLMSGTEYANTQYSDVPFDYSVEWDNPFTTFGQTVWETGISNQVEKTVAAVAAAGAYSIVLSDVSGLAVGYRVNITSYLINKFSSTADVFITGIDQSSNTIIVNDTLASDLKINDTIEFWLDTSDTSTLDKVINNGSWAADQISGAYGIDPTDLIIDGDNFNTVLTSYAPEELVPGKVTESLGISVYTRYPEGAPIVLSSSFDIIAGTTSTVTMGIVPPNISSISVVYNDKIFAYSTTTQFSSSSSSQFAVDWAANTVIVPPQPVSGKLGYTIISIGGGRPDTEAGVIDSSTDTVLIISVPVTFESMSTSTSVKSEYVTVNGVYVPPVTDISQYGYIRSFNTKSHRTSITMYNLPQGMNSIQARLYDYAITAGSLPGSTVGLIETVVFNSVVPDRTSQLQSIASRETIKSAYVTVNGRSIPLVTNSNTFGYMMTESSADQQRAAVNLYNLPIGTNAVQAWFFGTEAKYFNEIREQTFTINSTTSTFSLMYPPATIKPSAAQATVELTTNTGTRRLIPPYTSYYSVVDPTVVVYAVDSNKVWPVNSFTDSTVEVYVNGRALRHGFDFKTDPVTNSVTINSRILAVNDAIAVTGIPVTTDLTLQYRYDIIDSTLTLLRGVQNASLKVITYTDHDGMLMHAETFTGTPTRHYKMSRAAINSNYIWVQVNGIPLVNGIDYTVLEDQVTVQVSSKFMHSNTDDVVINSINHNQLASTVVGYRVFNDMFNRTHFKRLSKLHTTWLTQDLNSTDSYIHVNDASVLTMPIPSEHIPGIVIINGERIEFLTASNNTLGTLRRGTLGTATSNQYRTNTKVIDQSPDQTIPFTETVNKQQLMTMSNVDQYEISKITHRSPGAIYGDGIILSTGIGSGSDQVLVYYGDRLLNKVGVYTQDTSVMYDSPLINDRTDVEFVATAADIPSELKAINSAYVTLDTSKVWTYVDSILSSAVQGCEYSGLHYQAPEFTIDTESQLITLNIKDRSHDNVKLTIVKREFATSSMWNTINGATAISILDSTTLPALFLQAHPAELPTNEYYSR